MKSEAVDSTGEKPEVRKLSYTESRSKIEVSLKDRIRSFLEYVEAAKDKLN